MSRSFVDELERLRAEAPADPPSEVLDAARAEAGRLRSRRRSARNRGIGLALAVAAGLVGLAFTPPGRAATGWIADLAGIGEEPTVPQVGSVEGTARILASGELSDGTPYELVVKRVNGESSPVGANPSELPDLLCFQIDWPGVQRKAGGGFCTRGHRTGEGNPLVLETSGVFRAPGGGPNSPALFAGIADDSGVAAVEAFRVDREGNRQPLSAELLTVEGPLLELVAGDYPVSAFLLTLDEPLIEAGNENQAQVTVVALDASGVTLGRTTAFAPLSCPRNPETLLPDIPSGAGPRPVTGEEAEAFGRAAECGYEPPAGSGAAAPAPPAEAAPVAPQDEGATPQPEAPG